MGWPLLLALGTQAAQAESGSHDEKVAKGYAEANTKAEVEAWQRDLERAKEEARKAALQRALAAKSQPLGGTTGTYVDRPDKPTSWGRYTEGPAQAGATIGGYFANRPPMQQQMPGIDYPNFPDTEAGRLAAEQYMLSH